MATVSCSHIDFSSRGITGRYRKVTSALRRRRGRADNRRRRAFLESVVNFGTLEEPEDFGDASIMTSEFKNWRNRVERSASGGFNAIWRGQDVYENGRVKKFETEDDARAYLDRCDTAGRIIH